MTDTEILNWLLGELESGLLLRPVRKYFMDGEPWKTNGRTLVERYEEMKSLRASGRLENRLVGYRLEGDLTVEDSDTLGEGKTVRDAVLAAIAESEKA